MTLNTASAQIKAAISDLRLPSLLCDKQGQILFISPEAQSILGTSTQTGILWFELATDPSVESELASTWEGSTKAGIPWTRELRLRGRYEADLDVQVTGIPSTVTGLPGKSWLLALRDVTEDRIHARELEIYANELSELLATNKQYIRQLEEAEQSRDRFYSMVTHELKTPLTALKASLEMLQTLEDFGTSTTHVARIADNMQRATNRLDKMISDLVDVATTKVETFSLNYAAVDLGEVLDGTVAELESLATPKGVVLHRSTRHKRGLVVWGDAGRLHQVASNLISNAIKAVPSNGTVRLTLSRTAGYAILGVKSVGARLDSGLEETLFEPFQKSSSGGYQAGSGLGLTVVDVLTRAHGGTVTVVPGDNDVLFNVTIPLWKGDTLNANSHR